MLNQETAVNILLDKTEEPFSSFGKVVIIDPLLKEDTKVNDIQVRKAQSDSILSKLNLKIICRG